MAKKKQPPAQPPPPPPIDTEAVVEKGLRFLDNEMSKCLARSLSSGASTLNNADVNALTRMLKAMLEVKAERRMSAITAQEASKLSDAQLAEEINKLLAKRKT